MVECAESPAGDPEEVQGDMATVRVRSAEDAGPLVLDTLDSSWKGCKAVSKRLASTGRWNLGAAAAVLAALTGTTILATVTTDPAVWARCLVGVAALAAALLVGVQTWSTRQREELQAIRGQLHELHHEIEIKLDDFMRGKPLPDGYGIEVSRRYHAIDLDAVPSAGWPWREASREVAAAEWRDFRLSEWPRPEASSAAATVGGAGPLRGVPGSS